MKSSSPILVVKNLTKRFGDAKKSYVAVSDISFSVHSSEIVGLLGPNGAGKTTTIQMLLGLTTPTQGSIEYFGMPFITHRQECLQRINTTSGYARLPWKLSVFENLDVYGHLYSVPDHRKKIFDLCERFSATNLLKKQFQDLSAGQMTRILLIKAFLNDPEILLLDEPTASLDPDIAEQVREFILEERKKRNISVLITSHNMGEVEQMCDRVIFLHKGQIFANDTPRALARRNSHSELSLMVPDGMKRVKALIKEAKYLSVEKNRFITITLPEADIALFLTKVSAQNIHYDEIEIVRPSLEDFFLSVSHGRKV